MKSLPNLMRIVLASIVTFSVLTSLNLNHALAVQSISQTASQAASQTVTQAAKVQSCTDASKKLFAQPTIKIRVVFGYKDTRPARFVGDRHERLAFVEKILSPCEETSTAQDCGFVRSPKNADLFQKKIESEAGKETTVLLWVVNSSIGSDDKENRSDPFQAWRSNYAQAGFLSGLNEADVVFYNGHSRFGGGPDFAPPLIDKDGKIETLTYQNQKPGLNKFVEAFEGVTDAKASEHRLKFLGLFSCASNQHFKSVLREHSNAGLIVNKSIIYYADAMKESLQALSSLLERKCVKNLVLN